MDIKYSEFISFAKKSAAKFSEIKKEDVVRVISHLDADGICSAAIISYALKNSGFLYSLSIVNQLTEEVLLRIAKENYKYYVFADLGSGQYELIKKHLNERFVYILDHHSFENLKLNDISSNIVMINPHSFGIDGSSEVSGAGVAYLFSEALNESNKCLSHLAIIGAIGDVQENCGFSGLNSSILATAMNEDLIKVENGPKWFGIQSKPLHKLLTYSVDPLIPGISGNESNAVQFLKELGIEPKVGNDWIKFSELDDEQKSRLISAIVMRRKALEKPEDFIGERYILVKEPEHSLFRDAREFSTLLNACGRMDNASVGIGTCLNDKNSKRKSIEISTLYRNEIINSLRWYESSFDSGSVLKGKKYIIINAKNNVLSTIIGTMASIISKSGQLKPETLILSMAQNNDGTTKVSLRIAGENGKLNLREIINKIVEKSSGESGGHNNAAGAVIKTSSEDEFIKAATNVLESFSY